MNIWCFLCIVAPSATSDCNSIGPHLLTANRIIALCASCSIYQDIVLRLARRQTSFIECDRPARGGKMRYPVSLYSRQLVGHKFNRQLPTLENHLMPNEKVASVKKTFKLSDEYSTEIATTVSFNFCTEIEFIMCFQMECNCNG